MEDKEKVVKEVGGDGYTFVVNVYKKYVQPFLAIFIFVLLVMVVNGLSDYKSLQEEIRENCGWEDENYKCYCSAHEVGHIENALENYYTSNNISLENLENVGLVG